MAAKRAGGDCSCLPIAFPFHGFRRELVVHRTILWDSGIYIAISTVAEDAPGGRDGSSASRTGDDRIYKRTKIAGLISKNSYAIPYAIL
jgi:hypothetical protein